MPEQDGRNRVSEAEPPGSHPTRILIVDAYGHSREGLSASLRGAGWNVETAAGSGEAIQKVKGDPFGLAIIDLELPSAHGVTVSGWDLARIFRAFHPAAAVILVTAEWRADLKAEAERHGLRLVEKPINPAALRVLVRALESERARRDSRA